MRFASEDEARNVYDALLLRAAEADAAYYERDDPIMDDAEYDSIKLDLAAIEAEFPALVSAESPTQKVSGTATSVFEKIAHRQRMESLDNSFSPAEVAEWAGKNLSPDDVILGELKMDGLSLSVIYENGQFKRAVTRGDGVIGEDVSHTAIEIVDLPINISEGIDLADEVVEVRGEVYLSKEDFEAWNAKADGKKIKKLVNCRNGAAGALRQKDPDVTKARRIRFMAFGVSNDTFPDIDNDDEVLDLLEDCGFSVVPRFVVGNQPAAIQQQIDHYAERRPKLPFDIDGIVWKVNSRRERAAKGSTSRAPRWATAYKFPPEQKKTKLLDIVIQTGRTGALTPVGILEPVFVGGVTVSNVTLHNEDEINRLRLYKGAQVMVQRAGDVIPQITGLAPGEPFIKGFYTMPTQCPSCGGDTVRPEDEAVRRCINTADCPAQRQAHLEHFVSRAALNIDGLGPSQLADLNKYLRLTKASQIMKLPEATLYDFGSADDWCAPDEPITDLMPLWEGYGKTSVAKLMAAIKKARKQPLDRFIYALGIRNVGSTTAKDIAKHLKTVDAFFDAVMEDSGFWLAEIDHIDGVGPVVMESIESHFRKKANYDEVFALRMSMDLQDMPKVATGGPQPLAGEIVCFTGGLERWSRDQARIIAEELGASTTNSAAKSTTILVCGSGVGAVKMKKAEDNGTRCEDEAWFVGVVEEAVERGYKLEVMD